ncbi:hypothetical protein CFN78_26445 [Amycolatopsis antarctica]|uniref:FAD-binding FR-type domain-containing protein n=1 Tax=Amycolatopsis antarctica TaxID=1854586 RepID=A0A263CVT8_9PSEU|nr:FAD-binding oxidoreductase [Amycolatopsis antarctica]OZM70252.1 hypothetical protein CFN78_26445 [Amycolatopsis antarctica]
MTTLLPRARKGARTIASIAEALLTPHGVDRYLELVDPMLVRNEIRGVVTDVRRQTEGTVTLTVRPSRAWRGFTAGQYVRVTVDIDGVRRTRCYSPACSQYANGSVELTIKAAPDGLVSRHLHEHAMPGTVLGLSQPDGDFTVPAARPERILLVSGGSGITPVLSMLRTLTDEGYSGDIAFLHYANDRREVLYRAELDALAAARPNVRVVIGHTAEDTDTGTGADLHGLFTPEHLDRAAPWFRTAQTYLCGPTPLMNAVREAFENEGVGERLHTEEFSPPPLDIDPDKATGTVRFSRSGKEIGNTGHPLLEQAEDAGLSPEHGCRMGICFSCTKIKKSGRVRDARSGELSEDEGVEIQLCISVPVGDVDIDA